MTKIKRFVFPLLTALLMAGLIGCSSSKDDNNMNMDDKEMENMDDKNMDDGKEK